MLTHPPARRDVGSLNPGAFRGTASEADFLIVGETCILSKLKVVIADDNAAVLRQLVLLLATEFDVVATAENGLLALKHICQRKPDVGVLDLRMPILDGTEVTRQIQGAVPTTAIVICSVETDAEVIRASQRAGALGYVFKSRMTRDLIAAVKAVARGEGFVSDSNRTG